MGGETANLIARAKNIGENEKYATLIVANMYRTNSELTANKVACDQGNLSADKTLK